MPGWIETSRLEALIYPQHHQAEVLDPSVSQDEGWGFFRFAWGEKEVGLVFGRMCVLPC